MVLEDGNKATDHEMVLCIICLLAHEDREHKATDHEDREHEAEKDEAEKRALRPN